MTESPPALLVPPGRFGRLLREARLQHDEAVGTLVRRSGLACDEDFLLSVEAGLAALDEPTVRWLTELYGVRSQELVPARSRLVIDLHEGTLAIGSRETRFTPSSTDALLTQYLALVHELRGLPPGTPIKLRELDLDVLSTALQLRARDVQVRLHRLVTGDREPVDGVRRMLRRRLVVPLAGVFVGLAAGGGVLFERVDHGVDKAGRVGIDEPAR